MEGFRSKITKRNNAKPREDMMDRILVLGSDYGTLDIVKRAKKKGLYVIVSDTMPTSPTKEEADEAWQISTTDIDKLALKCKEENIIGVITGASDFNIGCSRKLCRKLGLPIYCMDDKAWEIATNKFEFKKICKSVGARVAEDYHISEVLTDDELNAVSYPVVVKPIDKSGNRGMSYCANKEELIEACKYARSVSDNSTIIVERELHGPEFAVNYILADGEIVLHFFSSEHNQPGEADNLYSMIITTSKHLKQYLIEMNKKVIEVFKKAGCRDGVAWVETILDEDGHFYLLEMGYRFGGEVVNVSYEKVCGFNSIDWMLDIALGKKHTKEDLPKALEKAYKSCAAAYMLFSERDDTIAKIEGLDEVEKLPNVYTDIPKREGSNVRYHATMGVLRIFAKNCNEMCKTIEKINSLLKIKNDRKENMFIYFNDFDTLKEEYENGLREFEL